MIVSRSQFDRARPIRSKVVLAFGADKVYYFRPKKLTYFEIFDINF